MAGMEKVSEDSLYCSSPRKSLVKGERFIRGLKRNQSDKPMFDIRTSTEKVICKSGVQKYHDSWNKNSIYLVY